MGLLATQAAAAAAAAEHEGRTPTWLRPAVSPLKPSKAAAAAAAAASTSSSSSSSSSFSWYEAAAPSCAEGFQFVHPPAKVAKLIEFLRPYSAAAAAGGAAAAAAAAAGPPQVQQRQQHRVKRLKEDEDRRLESSSMDVDGEPHSSSNSSNSSSSSSSSSCCCCRALPPCICVLQGPSGCGKRWLLMAAAASLGLEVLEFDEASAAAAAAAPPAAAAAAAAAGGSWSKAAEPLPLGAALLSFLSEAHKRRALPLGSSSSSNKSSSSKSSSSKSSSSKSGAAVILLRQLPATLLQRSPSFTRQLQQLLQHRLQPYEEPQQQQQQQQLQQQQQQGCAQPLVVCVGDSWEEQRLLQRFLPASLLNNPGVCTLRLNSPTEVQVRVISLSLFFAVFVCLF